MYYEIRGEGEPLVMIAGLGNDLTTFEPVIARLSEKYRVIAFDNRGTGRTDMPDIPYTIEMMADDTAGLLKALEIKQAYVLGISMGGRIALALALQHPELVKSLVLTSTFARQTKNTKGLFKLRLLRAIPGFSRMMSKYPQPDYAFELQRKASRSYDCSDRLDRISVPTLVLHGTKDTLAPISLAGEMHNEIKGSKMVTFEGGHVFFMGKSEQYCNAVLDFLASIDAK
jgi:pimeloyl-ACP methyl ester carboxylesterase